MKLSFETKQIIKLIAFLLLPLAAIKMLPIIVGENWMASRLSLFLALAAFAVTIAGVYQVVKTIEEYNNRYEPKKSQW